MELKRIIEAILFISPRPVTTKSLFKKIEDCSLSDIENAMKELVDEYRGSDRAIEIIPVSGGYQMRTKIEFKDWVKRFIRERDVELTRSVLEALAIIAYKQPVSKREIDVVRGVDSSRAIRQLLDKKLIEIAGRNDELGRPMVFKTTDRFLEVYGLNSLKDLPTFKEIEALEK
ncbi:MAG: SMC-Scp complex subunit ScpB [Syntrophorhabdaceae bacterium]|nr:SMC-Scp complex subunit ScpB [Syntrophorhabdales bacterium]MBP9560666.1 SMC-Scp complex subunit ScpB [Syntrophorhabdaceae bacterium]